MRADINSIFILPELLYTVVSDWLEEFAWRIPMTTGIFFIAGLSVIAITMLAISLQAFKAGFGSPIISLRSE